MKGCGEGGGAGGGGLDGAGGRLILCRCAGDGLRSVGQPRWHRRHADRPAPARFNRRKKPKRVPTRRYRAFQVQQKKITVLCTLKSNENSCYLICIFTDLSTVMWVGGWGRPPTKPHTTQTGARAFFKHTPGALDTNRWGTANPGERHAGARRAGERHAGVRRIDRRIHGSDAHLSTLHRFTRGQA